MAEHIETKCDEFNGTSKLGIVGRKIKREMDEVVKETDIAFTTDFWMSPMVESFMMMSMHWIT